MQKVINSSKRSLVVVLAVLMLFSMTSVISNITAMADDDAVFLETDIISSQRSNINMYPASGTFTMSGLSYSRGIANDNITAGSNNDGTATYRIEGRGFTRLSGEFGRISGSGGASLTITGDGKLLGGFELRASDMPIWLDIAIPSGIREINIRLQNGNNGLFALADAYFAASGPTQPNTHPPAVADAVYLENDIISTQRSNLDTYPALGSFYLNEQTYFRGLVNNNQTFGSTYDGTITYRIAGRGFTKLTGTFARVSGSGSAVLTVTGDGRLLGGYVLAANADPRTVNIPIPQWVQDISIRLQNGNNGIFALVETYFTATGPTPAPSHPPAADDAVYLENDIISTQRLNIDRYPASGSFSMSGVNYYRGIANNSTVAGANFDGSATYRIEGRGFTRLTGVFGRISGSGGAALTITADNTVLGGFEFGAGDVPRQIDVAIPPGAQHIIIRLQNGSGGLFAFADAYFAGGEAVLPPSQQTCTVSPVASPLNGGFAIGGGSYQSGVVITLEAAPNPGWAFSGWYENGIRVSTEIEWSFAVTADRNIEARFVQQTINNPHSSWATLELQRARELGIIPNSLSDATVDYRRPITRVEFAGIAVRTYEYLTNTTVQPASPNPFTDTQSTDALKALNAGLMVGRSDNEFDPNTSLTREEAAMALTRVFKRVSIPGWNFGNDAEHPLQFESPPPFADDMYINSWTREGVYFMAAMGIVQGMGDNMFAPRPVTDADRASNNGVALREHAIIMALHLIENLGDVDD